MRTPAGVWQTDAIPLDARNTNPRGITIAADGTISVVDSSDAAIYVRTPAGVWQTDAIPLDSRNGGPQGIAIAADGTLYVTDSGDDAIYVRSQPLIPPPTGLLRLDTGGRLVIHA